MVEAQRSDKNEIIISNKLAKSHSDTLTRGKPSHILPIFVKCFNNIHMIILID